MDDQKDNTNQEEGLAKAYQKKLLIEIMQEDEESGLYQD